VNGVLAAVLSSALGWNLLLGIGGVGAGIWLASTDGGK
jgi:hypothetical protein